MSPDPAGGPGEGGGGDGSKDDPTTGPGGVPSDVPDRIEHTVLGPRTTWDEVAEVLDAAIREGMRACVPPCHLADAVDYAPSLDVATVVAFPHGQSTTETKAAAARQAYADGAAEIDLVANSGLLASGDEDTYETDLAEAIAAVPVPVKVIVEAPLLEEAELRRACERAVAADADFLKTATGFADGGATVEDVATMSDYGPVKASGGIGSWEKAREMFRAGADRIGASSGDVIAAEYRDAVGDRGSDSGL